MNLYKITTEYIDNSYSIGSHETSTFFPKLLEAVSSAEGLHKEVKDQLDYVVNSFIEEGVIADHFYWLLIPYLKHIEKLLGIDLTDEVREATRRKGDKPVRNYEIDINLIREDIKGLDGAGRALYGLAAVGLPVDKHRVVTGYDEVNGIIQTKKGDIQLEDKEIDFIQSMSIFAEDGPMDKLIMDVYDDTGDDTIDRKDVNKIVKKCKDQMSVPLSPIEVAMSWRVSYCRKHGTSGYKYVGERQLLSKGTVQHFGATFYEWWYLNNWISADTYQACMA